MAKKGKTQPSKMSLEEVLAELDGRLSGRNRKLVARAVRLLKQRAGFGDNSLGAVALSGITAGGDEPPNARLLNVSALGLSTRVVRLLHRNKIYTIGDALDFHLTKKPRGLLGIRYFGDKVFEEVRSAFAAVGVKLEYPSDDT